MIRVRHRDGRVLTAPAGASIEIVDRQGRLVMVVVDLPDGTRCSTPGDPLFHAHANTHRMIASNVIVHEPAPRTASRI